MRSIAALALTATALLVGTTTSSPADASVPQGMTFLDNGIVRVGVDLSNGAKITFVGAATGASTNLVQDVQPSYYSGPYARGRASRVARVLERRNDRARVAQRRTDDLHEDARGRRAHRALRVPLRAVGDHQGPRDPRPQPAHGLALRRDPLRRVAAGAARPVHDRPHLPRVHLRRPQAVHGRAAPRGDRGRRRILQARPELARHRALGGGRRRRRLRHRPVQARPRAVRRHPRHARRRVGQRLPRRLDDRGDRRQPGVRLRLRARRRVAAPDPRLRVRQPSRRAARLPLPHRPAALVVQRRDRPGLADPRSAARARGLVCSAHVRARGLVARPRRPRRLRPARAGRRTTRRSPGCGWSTPRAPGSRPSGARSSSPSATAAVPHLSVRSTGPARVHRVDHGPRASRRLLDAPGGGGGRRRASRGGRASPTGRAEAA